MNQDKLQKISNLAQEVIHLSRNTLLVKLRFLDVALSKLGYWESDDTTISTDGIWLVYDPRFILESYKEERESVTRYYLHLVLHCIFRHMFIKELVDHDCWNLACDIAVEYSIYKMELKSVKVKGESAEEKVFKELQEKGVMLTAEKLYRYFLDQKLEAEQLQEYRNIFGVDDHEIWYMTDDQKSEAYVLPGKSKNNKNNNQNQESSSSSGGTGSSALMPQEISQLEREWKDVSDQIQMDMQTLSQMQGNTAGGMLQNLREVNREKYDYTSFLKKFAVMGEVMKINDYEFDYIYYTYGLKLFKKVPLIEPLEYKDVKRIKEFVIAIDTSGSTSGELVQKFVQKTYNILKTTESFFQKINLHIIQCDAAIQEHVKITTQEEFNQYLSTMTIKGHGGTDFIPVFQAVDELIQAREFSNLKGLIYFTDGYGTFPANKPTYDTAFVFVKTNYELPNVPSWAIRLVLQPEEI